IEVDELIFGNLACGNAILNRTEKELGVLLIDMGAGSSDISIFINDNIAYSSILPLGGIQVTNDLAIGLKISIEEAERLKIKYGNVMENYVSPDDVIEIMRRNESAKESISKKYLIDIIEPRVHEIFSLIREEVERSNYLSTITQGVVLTGGCALLPGITDLASKVFERNVHIGRPNYLGELNDLVNEPRFSTVMGLLDYSMEQITATPSRRTRRKKSGSTLQKAINWLRDFF
ncbi:MAG: cell division protein FtsA, partial [Atribacterota bacterium]